jgi:hypothetical protein
VDEPVRAVSRVVPLRNGEDDRYLWAYLDQHGRLHIDGEDYGPKITVVTNRDSYEWFKTIAAADIPSLCELLGGAPDDDILAILEEGYCGPGSYELELLLRDSDIEVELFVI